MFDVRPVNSDGSLDMKRIGHLRKTVKISEKSRKRRVVSSYEKVSDVKIPPDFWKTGRLLREEELNAPSVPENARQANVVQMGKIIPNDHISISKIPDAPKIFGDSEPINGLFRDDESFFLPRSEKIPEYITPRTEPTPPVFEEDFEKTADEALLPLKLKKSKRKKKIGPAKEDYLGKSIHVLPIGILPRLRLSYVSSFASALIIFSMLVPAAGFIQKGFDTQTDILKNGHEALGQFAEAKDNLATGKFDSAAVNFEQSYETLSDAKNSVSDIGGGFREILRFIPGVSKVASAEYLLSAGENFAVAGKSLSESAKAIGSLQNPLNRDDKNSPALTDIFLSLREGVQSASDELAKAEESLDKVNPDDLPDEIRPQFLTLKDKLPVVSASLKNFLDYSRIFLDVLGYNGPRKFLFLFQNNQEMRATGGFIGSYGLLDISDGRVKKLLVDDIYNPDGQLKARVIPPEPIQKMSAVWTMHDANWFPDFPTSAEKVSWFYEKTGGPTVDGVIAVTPSLMEDLLKVTGPINMPEYDTTVDAGNFIEKTQYEVEVDYDKQLNQPKKFVADLMPKILDQLFSTRDAAKMIEVMSALSASLKEKQLLLYSKNYDIQKLISSEGWSGEILNTPKDYLSVVNTNINGFKTDGVIDETIRHQSEIQGDGSIVDTVSITRRHNGGNEKYDWWNKVNGDYMRVYVPENSKLLEADGQTRETVSPPLDYQNLGFKKDPQVASNEDSTEVDDKTGTRIYSENQKTVFANWVYVSPGESVTLTYKYILPFKLNFETLHHPADSFSVLYQKQSGSLGSHLQSDIKLPQNLSTIWHWPENVDQKGNDIIMNTDLQTDKFVGFTVEKK